MTSALLRARAFVSRGRVGEALVSEALEGEALEGEALSDWTEQRAPGSREVVLQEEVERPPHHCDDNTEVRQPPLPHH